MSEANTINELVKGTGVVITPTPLTPDQKEYKQFEVAKYVAGRVAAEKKCYASNELERLDRALASSGLQDERVLLKFITEGVNTHNGKLDGITKKRSTLRHYGKWWESKLLKGCDFNKIRKLVDQFQHEDVYEIYKFYFGEGKLIQKKEQA